MSTYAVIDFTNFYVSCERVFNPALEQQPIVILSHQTGCVVALSKEAERTGIKIGDPYLKCQSQCEQHRVHVLASNYELYGDMSARVISCLQTYCPTLQIQSIDEVCMQLDTLQFFDLHKYFAIIQKEMKASIGIPIAIGYAPTKTLAKLANQISKLKDNQGIFSLCNPNIRLDVLKQIPVEEVMGIDCRTALFLKKMSIITAEDLTKADPKLIRRKFSINIEKIMNELNGDACLANIEINMPRKQIISTCVFDIPVAQLELLQEAISTYTARACITLQTQQSVSAGIYVFLNSSFNNTKHYANAITHHFTNPTADTGAIITSARHSLQKIYQYGYAYQKAGIMLMDIIPAPLQTLEHTNPRRELKSLFFSEHVNKHNGVSKRNKIPRRYTTQWHELPVVNCN
jgi:DNA polymerase V